MNAHNQLLFFFSALGTFNCSLLSIYFLFFAKPKRISNHFLGALLGVISIRIWKSVFYYFNPELAKIYLQIGLSALIFIGPFLYLFIKSKTVYPQKMKPYWKYFLSILVLFVVIGGFLYPYQRYPELWNNNYFFKFIHFFWLSNIIASLFLIKELFIKMISKNIKLDYSEVLSLSVFLGVSIIWIAYYTSNLTSYIIGALSFSFVLYLSILVLFYKRKTHSSKIKKKEKYAKNKISTEESKRLFEKINLLMMEQYLYRDSNLNLSKLAKKLNISSHLLSQFLNDNLNKSFSLFVNEYRINEARRLLKTEHNLKTEVIAENCGFNSTSTFYAAFKKIANTTPAKYIKNTDL